MKSRGDAMTPGGRTVRLLLEYDGGPYHGWQIQPGQRTVQGALREAVGRITGETPSIQGAGRTDAGVHALGQVAHFRTSSSLPVPDLTRALNAVLPRTITVLDAQEGPEGFDARYSALSKTYRYRILLRRCRSSLEEGRLWHIPWPVKVGSVRRAAALLVGRHDFSSFRSSGCASRSPVRCLNMVRVRRRGDHLLLDFNGDGFLRHMVRAMVGTLVAAGRGRFAPRDMAAIMAARSRSRAGPAAPACGLYLVEVRYPQEISWDFSR